MGKFSPLLSSKRPAAHTRCSAEKEERSPCVASVPTTPFPVPCPQRTEDRTLGRACRIPIQEQLFLNIQGLDCKIQPPPPREDARVVDLSSIDEARKQVRLLWSVSVVSFEEAYGNVHVSTSLIGRGGRICIGCVSIGRLLLHLTSSPSGA